MMEEPQLIKTEDGSDTLFLPTLNETYHSRHGAVTESVHVFIKNGLYARLETEYPEPLRVMEVGLGTGLNCLLTILACEKQRITLDYVAVEPFPLSTEKSNSLNYSSILKDPDAGSWFNWIHETDWENPIEKKFIKLRKLKDRLQKVSFEKGFDLIYFDAFAPEKQPELWTQEIFKKLFSCMNDFAFLCTYSAKGQVRRDLLSSGFIVEKMPGAPGKREMIRAAKPPQNS